MNGLRWDDLTPEEQHALERVAAANTIMLTSVMVSRLKELDLAEDRIGGIKLSRAGTELLAIRGS